MPGAPAPGADASNPFSSVFADAPPESAKAPASNAPVMNAPPMANGYAGGYGQPPMMGQPPMGQPAPMMGQPPMGHPPMMGQPPMQGGMDPGMQQYGMAPPMGQQPPQAYGGSMMNSMGSMGPPQPPQQPGMGAPQYSNALVPAAPAPTGPPAGGDPFASFGAPAPAGPPQGIQQSNSFDGSGAPPQQQPPYGAPPTPQSQAPPVMPNDPFASYSSAPAPPQPGAVPPSPGGYGAPPPANDPYGYGAPPANDFGGYGAPPTAPPVAPPANDPFAAYGAPPAAAPPANNPYGAPPAYNDPYGAPQPDPNMGALVPSSQPSNPYAQQAPYQQQQAPPAADPFSVFNAAPAPTGPPPGAMVPAQAPPPQQQAPPPPAAGSDDMWGDLGFDAPPSAQPNAAPPSKRETVDHGEKKEEGGLPPGGEFYDARIFTPTLGVMFFKPQELTDSLFLNTDRSVVDSLNERPVVAFIVEGSSARSAGVELGHVLLKVNGVDVKNPKEASRLIKEGPRPLPLLFYVPSADVVVAEGEHMVKYDTRETTAPNSAKDWKPKYVVIGGIIAQPWMINMYRSKSEYDIAVIETQARRPVSVKVKQFSLQGARIQNDWQGPQMVKYKNKLHPWKYVVVLPVARNPIKISSPNLAQLKPVHEGIRRVLLAQQRQRGGNPHSAAPSRQQQSDPYQRPQQHSDPYGGHAPAQNGYAPQHVPQHVPQQQQQQQQQAYRGY